MLVIVLSTLTLSSSEILAVEAGQVLGLQAVTSVPLINASVGKTPLPKDTNISKPKFTTPDKPWYFIKTFFESTQVFTTFDRAKKSELRLALANERFSEIKYLLDNAKLKHLPSTSKRYSQLALEASQDLKVLKQKGVDVSELAQKVEKQLVVHQIFAESLINSPQSELKEATKNLFASSQKVLDRFSDVKSEPPIPQELSESLLELSKLGILTQEEINRLFGLKSREEVRAQLLKLNEKGEFPLTELKKLDREVKQNFPEYYKSNLENLKYAELKSYSALPSPTKEVLDQIEEISSGKVAGAIPESLKPYLIYKRILDLSKDIDFRTLETKKAQEIASFYPRFVKDNPTVNQELSTKLQAESGKSQKAKDQISSPTLTSKSSSPPYPSASGGSQCPTGWHYVAGSTPWCQADLGNNATPPGSWPIPICKQNQIYTGIACLELSYGGSETCPPGWSHALLSGGSHWWCLADLGNNATPPSSWKIPICAQGYWWNKTSCSANVMLPPHDNGGPRACPTTPVKEVYKEGYGCVARGGTWGYCGPGYFWVGDSCAHVTAGQTDCGPGFDSNGPGQGCREIAPPNCPVDWHWVADNGGWCQADSGNSSEAPGKWVGQVNICRGSQTWNGTTCVDPPTSSASPSNSPTPSASGGSKCPGGWHYVAGSTPWCQADLGNNASPPSWNIPICAQNQYYTGSSCLGWGDANCPVGWTWELLSGGSHWWCVADPDNNATPPNWKIPICANGYYWNKTSCTPNVMLPPHDNGGSRSCPTSPVKEYYKEGYGCVARGGTWGYCGPGYFWVGDSCAHVTAGQTNCGPGYASNGPGQGCREI